MLVNTTHKQHFYILEKYKRRKGQNESQRQSKSDSEKEERERAIKRSKWSIWKIGCHLRSKPHFKLKKNHLERAKQTFDWIHQGYIIDSNVFYPHSFCQRSVKFQFVSLNGWYKMSKPKTATNFNHYARSLPFDLLRLEQIQSLQHFVINWHGWKSLTENLRDRQAINSLLRIYNST